MLVVNLKYSARSTKKQVIAQELLNNIYKLKINY